MYVLKQSALFLDSHLFVSPDPPGPAAAGHSDPVDTMGRPPAQAKLLARGYHPLGDNQQPERTPETQAAPPGRGDPQDCSVQVPDGQGD